MTNRSTFDGKDGPDDRHLIGRIKQRAFSWVRPNRWWLFVKSCIGSVASGFSKRIGHGAQFIGRSIRRTYLSLRPYEWGLIAIAYIAVLGLGIWGFKEAFSDSSGALSYLDAIYRSFQLVVLEGGTRVPDDSVIPLQLQVARFGMPAIAAYAGMKVMFALFREQFGLLSISVFPPLIVICGLGERGFLIARSQRERGERVVVIEKDLNNALIEPCRRTGAVVLLGDATIRMCWAGPEYTKQITSFLSVKKTARMRILPSTRGNWPCGENQGP